MAETAHGRISPDALVTGVWLGATGVTSARETTGVKKAIEVSTSLKRALPSRCHCSFGEAPTAMNAQFEARAKNPARALRAGQAWD